MIRVTFITRDGKALEVAAAEGASLMETAIRHGVPGIEAECGGACSCATCHVYVEEAWRVKLGDPDMMEADMLEMAYEVVPQSRLACQIRMTPALDGLTVRLPARQV
ncbi:MAG TPA: 2Fe-2S iron-sulfur cluster-binding protein [Nordella sp.]|nr:2Fe-2S iron-sulfur cluster-binding protein [Nordella sp.]